MQFIDCSLYLIRHGQSQGNLYPNLIGQSPNTKLTELGIKQANLLGNRLQNQKIDFDFIYSSTYDRAIQTSEIVCEWINEDKNNIILAKELREYSAGSWVGNNRNTFLTPEIIECLDKQNMGFMFPDGESYNQVERRACEWLEKTILYNKDLIKENKNLKIALFSHGQTIKCILHYVLGFDKSMLWKIHLENTSISIVRFNKAGWHLYSINDCGHLIER